MLGVQHVHVEVLMSRTTADIQGLTVTKIKEGEGHV